MLCLVVNDIGYGYITSKSLVYLTSLKKVIQQKSIVLVVLLQGLK